MAQNFLRDVQKLNPKVSLKYADSPIYILSKGKFLDQGLLSTEFQIDYVKAFLRSYRNNKNKIDFEIVEAEFILSFVSRLKVTSDQFFDYLERKSKVDSRALSMLNDFLNCFIKGLPLNVPD